MPQQSQPKWRVGDAVLVEDVDKITRSRIASTTLPCLYIARVGRRWAYLAFAKDDTAVLYSNTYYRLRLADDAICETDRDYQVGWAYRDQAAWDYEQACREAYARIRECTSQRQRPAHLTLESLQQLLSLLQTPPA